MQESVDTKGFSSIATSIEMNANIVDNIYSMRKASEKQYFIFKSQLGYDIVSIIRNELENKCIEVKKDTNVVMREMCQLVITQYPEKGYLMIHTENKRQIEFLRILNVIPDDLNEIAKQENQRLASKINYQIHSLPKREKINKKGPGRPKGSKNLKMREKKKKIKRKISRPKGLKNKKNVDNQGKTND